MFFDKQLSKSLCFKFVHYVKEKITCFSMAAKNIRELE